MVTVILTNGRSAQFETADFPTCGELGWAAAQEVGQLLGLFSLKVNGDVARPETDATALTDTDVLEVIDVSDYPWSDEAAELVDDTETADDAGELEVPSGTIHEILDWVGDSPARAERAIAVERDADEPRTTLIARLADRLAP